MFQRGFKAETSQLLPEESPQNDDGRLVNLELGT